MKIDFCILPKYKNYFESPIEVVNPVARFQKKFAEKFIFKMFVTEAIKKAFVKFDLVGERKFELARFVIYANAWLWEEN
jgi:hypothetical protein